MKGSDGDCYGDANGTNCRTIECTDNTTATTDSACNTFKTGCVTIGVGCATAK